MKRKTKVIIAASALAVGAVAFTCASYSSLKKAVEALSDSFTVTAHTGCENTQDNSLESILVGRVNGADIVEFDLHFDSDGNPVLSHDEPEGKCVTLDEAFTCVARYEDLKVNVDVKNTKNLTAVALCAREHGLSERIFYTGITENDVQAVKQQTPEISYYLNVDVDKTKKHDKIYLAEIADTVENAGAVGINFHYSNCTKELVEVFRERGLLVSVWTVNNKFDMQRILRLLPDNITTRYPSKLKKII